MGDEASQIRLRMLELDQERQTLERRLRELQQVVTEPPAVVPQSQPKPFVTNSSPATDKIALFRRLLGGRTDVFPVRGENPKAAVAGDIVVQ